MSVIVKTMGGSISGGTEYEQIINYTMLYDEGDECEDVTGGWSDSNYSQSSYTMVGGTKNSDNLQVVTGAGTSRIAVLGTVNTIDFSGYKMLHALMEWTTGDSSQSLRAYSSKTLSGSVMAFAGFQPNTLNTKEFKSLDVTEYQNSYYLVLMANTSTTASTSRGGKMYHTFLTKSDDITTLAEKAGITASSIDDILAASETLLANRDAVKFMVKQCTGDFMASAIINDTFLTALNSSKYKSVVQANEHWVKFLAMVA